MHDSDDARGIWLVTYDFAVGNMQACAAQAASCHQHMLARSAVVLDVESVGLQWV